MGKRVLIVEDYEDSRQLMRHLIEAEGHSVIEAAGAYEGIEKAERYRPDLIFMDIGLPLLDGLSAAKIILGKKNLTDVPIVIVTAFHDINDQARDAGCSGVIYKPVNHPILKNILEFHLAGH
ncbi:MAG TPA: response regulator [Pyrinomonadaceae bacterium]|nr:response regulator [Pyrinomonadaceae bacterium]